MNTPEKRAKLNKMKKRVHQVESEVQKLQLKVKQLTQEQGESIDIETCYISFRSYILKEEHLQDCFGMRAAGSPPSALAPFNYSLMSEPKTIILVNISC